MICSRKTSNACTARNDELLFRKTKTQDGGQQAANASKPTSNFQGQLSSPAARKYAVQQKRHEESRRTKSTASQMQIAHRYANRKNRQSPLQTAASGADCSLLCRLG